MGSAGNAQLRGYALYQGMAIAWFLTSRQKRRKCIVKSWLRRRLRKWQGARGWPPRGSGGYVLGSGGRSVRLARRASHGSYLLAPPPW